MTGIAGDIARPASMGAGSCGRESQLRLALNPEADIRPEQLLIASAADVATGRALLHQASRLGGATLPKHRRVGCNIRVPVQQDATALAVSQRTGRERSLSGFAHGAGEFQPPAPERLDTAHGQSGRPDRIGVRAQPFVHFHQRTAIRQADADRFSPQRPKTVHGVQVAIDTDPAVIVEQPEGKVLAAGPIIGRLLQKGVIVLRTLTEGWLAHVATPRWPKRLRAKSL